ncbi:mitochondrial ribosomal protein subunit L20-domain-containing protein [Xylaria nigripes]|nr:mitochondrial ribosomal protein subunit L20-domain-containing protein [Xylaria nigripes]
MEIRQVLRPLSNLAHAPYQRTLTFPSLSSQRYQSTTSRTKKMLKIAPHPDFLAPPSGHNHIIYNPPASTPSVFETPFKFLPKSDPRRRNNLSGLVYRASTPAAAPGMGSTAAPLPPLMGFFEKDFNKYTMTAEQVEEMRALRIKDPFEWSVQKLAQKFNCSPIFVMKCCKASPEHKSREKLRVEDIRARWSPAKARAKAEKKKRQILLLQGAL